MVNVLAPNGFAFVLNTSLPQRSLQRFPYISMIFSDLKHMCPKAEAVAAKYSTLLQGLSYLWNAICEIYKCHRQAPWSSWYKQCTGWGNLRWDGVMGLKQDWNSLCDLPESVTWICFCRAYDFQNRFQPQFYPTSIPLTPITLAHCYIVNVETLFFKY